MSWAVAPLPAALNSVPFLAESIEDEVARALIRHTYPDRDGADLEDMGAAPRVVTVSGLIVGDDWLERVRAMEAAIARPGATGLTHPQFGTLAGRVERLSVRHVHDAHNQVAISLTFVVGRAETSAFTVSRSSSSASAAVRSAADDVRSALSALEG